MSAPGVRGAEPASGALVDVLPSTSAPAVSRRSARRRWYLAGHLLVGGWLLAALGVALAHPFLPHPRWLLVHLLLLGAVSTAVLIWSEHFALALLHCRDDGSGRGRGLKLGTFTVGAIGVSAGVVSDTWPLVVAGAAMVGAAMVGHVVTLARMARDALAGRFAVVLRYYVAAASLLPVGAALGVLLSRPDLDDDTEARLRLAHEAVNVLGWLGLTIVGTLVTLWPTMLRTRLPDGAVRAARWAVPLLLTGTAFIAAGALVTPPRGALVGLGCYLAGVAISARPLVDAARRKPPAGAATWSVAAGGGWLASLLIGLAVVLGISPTWTLAGERLTVLTPMLAVGWIAQTLFGALSYLVPVLLGGGPRTVRAMVSVLDRRGATRVTILNAGLAVSVLPVPSIVRVASSTLVLAALIAHAWSLVAAARTGRALRRQPDSMPVPPGAPATPGAPQRTAQAAAGLAVVVLAVAAGAAVDPGSLPTPGGVRGASVSATGHTTTVTVRAQGMRFSPAHLDVPAGDRLVIVVRNQDDDRHDLVLSNGARSPRLAAGRSHTLDAGVVGGDLDGWCSVVGHRQMGMVLTVHAVGAPPPAASQHAAAATRHAAPADDGRPAADAGFDPMAVPPAGFAARDARLAPVPASTRPQVHRRTITVREVEREVAPGVRQRAWTFDGTVPGPVLRGRVGDSFEITLVNRGSVGHSIDFHAGSLAPGPVMRTIQPGESLQYRFTAGRSGIWMYHCSTMPMSLHIANGMFGAVIVDPPGLTPVAREYVLIQSEAYLGPQSGIADTSKLHDVRPDAVVFNGYPHQYVATPLAAAPDERVRIWVLAAGPNLGTAFHVVGGHFDTVYAEGAYLLRPADPAAGGAQVLDLGPAGGGFVELTFPEPGTYPFVSHRMVDAERGARGAFTVR